MLTSTSIHMLSGFTLIKDSNNDGIGGINNSIHANANTGGNNSNLTDRGSIGAGTSSSNHHHGPVRRNTDYILEWNPLLNEDGTLKRTVSSRESGSFRKWKEGRDDGGMLFGEDGTAGSSSTMNTESSFLRHRLSESPAMTELRRSVEHDPSIDRWLRSIWKDLLCSDLGLCRMPLTEIYSFFKRRHQLKYTAMEITDVNGYSVLFSCESIAVCFYRI